MAKNKAIYSNLIDYNTKYIFVGDDRSPSFVGFGTVHVYNGEFNYVLCVPSILCILQSIYHITHSSEGKTMKFSPH